MPNLSENQHTVVRLLEAQPYTSTELAETIERSRSYIYDIIQALRQKGYDVEQNVHGEYVIGTVPDSDGPSYVTNTRQTAAQKAKITKDTKRLLAEMEYGLLELLDRSEPQLAEREYITEGTQDLVIHRTDDHFGEVVTNQYGDELFNSEIAQERVEEIFAESMRVVDQRRAGGIDFESVHLLLGGDIVTNDAIYEGQKNDTDESVREQVERAANVYMDAIRTLSDEFDHVQVATQVGNHGRLQGASINADGIVYSLLDHMVRENSSLDNVKFMQSDKSYYLDFTARNYDVHLRHGHDASLQHIGTNAAKSRWRSWLIDHEFDAAFRGHYHSYKEEPINGRPVHMGGSLLPQTEFEESNALSSYPVGAVHGMTDRAPTEWTHKIYFD